MPDLVSCFTPALFFLVGGVFGVLTYIARYLWKDKPKTQLFSVLAIMGTVGLIMWALIYL
jgi:hypothetical protein